MRSEKTQRFYDEYWPRNVPRAEMTREYVFGIIPRGRMRRVLDAGCGTGVCSLALAERSEEVIALDFSQGPLDTLSQLCRQAGLSNVRAIRGSVLSLPLADASVDFVWCWGVIHHTSEPRQALAELVRVLRPEGNIILAVYLKTWLTPLHEAARRVCLRTPSPLRRPFIQVVAFGVSMLERILRLRHARPDNVSIAAQVEDWYFVPEKHFFSIDEMHRLFRSHGLAFEVLEAATGRFRSSSNFTVFGRKVARADGA